LSHHLQAQTPKVFYEIFIRSFCDSNNDGKGDLNGITSKLDYLHDLGVEGIWITPFCKSPSYHKYDVLDYKSVDAECGTMGDLEQLIFEAHKRDIKVLFDFVVNHTSSQHRWFQEAKKGKDNPYRNYYSWLTPAQIKAKGVAEREKTADSTETQPWHWSSRGEEEKYYGMFWSGMPDLNMDNPNVRSEIYEIGRFWLEKGIDGFRMDAAKHIYPEWDAVKCHAFWMEFRQKMESVKPDVYIVGEVWTSAEKVAPFFKGLKANFNFDLCFAIQDIVKNGKDAVDIVSKLIQNYAIFAKENPDFVDATMLSNHDQNRIGSVAGGNLDKLKMAANLLFTLPGNPYIYYGEELGMKGTKPDENIREAFLWDKRSDDRHRTNWRKPTFNTDSRTMPLKQQMEDENSLYHHYKKLIALRKSTQALAQISPPNLEKSDFSNKRVVSFIRPHKEGKVLVIQNITGESVEIVLKKQTGEVIFSTNKSKMINQKAILEPYGILIIKQP
jgi:alpha-amylase